MVASLSYVFWHWPRRRAAVQLYEARLATFQSALLRSSPPGLSEVLSFRLDRLPWKTNQGHCYEDWYVVQDFAALGALNTAAVATPMLRDHDSVAEMASGGAGAVYKPVKGALTLGQARTATWFQKPPGFSYQSLYEAVDARTGKVELTLWQRQMALGPAPEFCLHTFEDVQLPSTFRPVRVRMSVVSRD